MSQKLLDTIQNLFNQNQELKIHFPEAHEVLVVPENINMVPVTMKENQTSEILITLDDEKNDTVIDGETRISVAKVTKKDNTGQTIDQTEATVIKSQPPILRLNKALSNGDTDQKLSLALKLLQFWQKTKNNEEQKIAEKIFGGLWSEKKNANLAMSIRFIKDTEAEITFWVGIPALTKNGFKKEDTIIFCTVFGDSTNILNFVATLTDDGMFSKTPIKINESENLHLPTVKSTLYLPENIKNT